MDNNLNRVIYIIAFVFIYNSKTFAQKIKKKYYVNFQDSIAVSYYVKNSTLLKQINLAEKNLGLFVESKGYTYIILASICKLSKKSITFTPINGNMVMPKQYLENELHRQLVKIKKEIRSFASVGASLKSSPSLGF